MPEQQLSASELTAKYPGLNFEVLQQESLALLQKISASIWTDYNISGPGITIMEALIGQIMDLSYRLTFDITDLLAYGREEKPIKQFFTSREILSAEPLTLNDYRKIIIDNVDIKNAWMQQVTDYAPNIYYDIDQHTLGYSEHKRTQQLSLGGIYDVLLEREEESEKTDEQLIAEVRETLNQHRSLSEDFHNIRVLAAEVVSVQADIEIKEGFDANELLAQINFELENFITPSMRFHTLAERLQQGLLVDEIFEGPLLEHGFIEDAALEKFDKKTVLRVSDLVSVILALPGVKHVVDIKLTSDKNANPNDAWSLRLDENCAPQLKALLNSDDILNGDVTLSKKGIQVKFEPFVVAEKYQVLKASILPKTLVNDDVVVPQGTHRELLTYQPLQNLLPSNYGVGELGLPASATNQRKAQALQLQAYLSLFEQVIANYLAQYNQAKYLLAVNQHDEALLGRSYVSQPLRDALNRNKIVIGSPEDYRAELQVLTEQDDDDNRWARSRRILEHLLARHGEQFTDASLLTYEKNSQAYVQALAKFLENYPQLSATRGLASNYANDDHVWNTNAVSGLKKRIAALLDIDAERGFLGCDDVEREGFFLLENILLRPRNTAPDINNALLSFSHEITALVLAGDSSGHVSCESLNHRLQVDDAVEIINSVYYDGIYNVLAITEDSFIIDKQFTLASTGDWVHVAHVHDPYSFQVSFVFPQWLGRFVNAEFRQLVEDVVVAETPAHLTVNIYWFDKTAMRYFDIAYKTWLEKLAQNLTDPIALDAAAINVISLLQFAEVLTSFSDNAIGKMIIGDDFAVNLGDPSYCDHELNLN
ncbi:MAG: hypothetical protein JKY13_03150 [Gammaproteobacteria bacterium]|nr:hypothetical protein [Gammaproteobacteria bacterium]